MSLLYSSSGIALGDLELSAYESELGLSWGVDKDGLDGWEDGTASTLQLTQRARQSGGWGGRAYAAGRHIGVKGWIKSETPAALLDAKDRLKAACSLDDTPFRVTELGVERWAMVRSEDIPIVRRRSLFHATFSIQLVADDWRQFGGELSGTTALPSSSGGVVLPMRVPLRIAETTVTGQVALTNPGNESGPVRLRITGPCVGPVVTHVSTGIALVFSSSLVLGAGEWIDVDMEAQTVLANGQSSRNGWITSRGWSQFEPGDNVWSFTAATFNPASRLTVTATQAWK